MNRIAAFLVAAFVVAALAVALVASRAAAATAPSVSEERPAPDALIGSRYPQVYARLTAGDTAVDPSTVRVLVDGADVSDVATISSDYIAYTPASAMADGTHTVEVTGASLDGAPFDARWSFRIDSGVSYGDVAPTFGGMPSAFGNPRFGFSPPGFSVFAPGPQFFFEDEPVIIVFFSPFFPNGSGFFTLTGFPGQFVMTPWLGCPGFFWGAFSVPVGVIDPDAVVVAHFSTADGRTVIVHGTAPLHLDGTRRTWPASMRFAVRARLLYQPKTPRSLVAFSRLEPSVPLGHRVAPGRSAAAPIARQAGPSIGVMHRAMPLVVGRTEPVVRVAPPRFAPMERQPMIFIPRTLIAAPRMPVHVPMVRKPPN